MAVSKSGEISTAETVAEITYVVKENAEKGNTTISAKEIITSSDGDEVEASEVETTIEIIEAGENPEEPTEKELSSIEVTILPTKTKYTTGEKFDKTGMKVTAKYSDGSSKEIEGYTYSPAGELKTSDKEITISYTEGDITKTAKVGITVTSGTGNNNASNGGATSGNKVDNTTADKEYPKTGAKTVILPIFIIAILAIVSYVGYKRYREI